MALFGGATTTKTSVKPSDNVANLLKQIATMTNQMDVGSYINHDLAGFNSTQQGALDALTNNTALNQVAGMYGDRTQQGINQYGDVNSMLQNLANSPVTGQNVNDFTSSMLGNKLNQTAINQGTSAGNAAASLGGGAAVRAANKTGANNIAALTNNSRQQSLNAMGANVLQGNNSAQLGAANLLGNIANSNIGLGNQSAALNQTAMMNALGAGNQQQAQTQNEYNNDWQNALGAQQFDWNQLNNKLNVLNSLSPMAGYTTTGVTPGISQGQQLLGAGISALSTYGSLGGFTGAGNVLADNGGNAILNSKGQQQYTNQWYNNGGTGALNGLTNWFSS